MYMYMYNTVQHIKFIIKKKKKNPMQNKTETETENRGCQ